MSKRDRQWHDELSDLLSEEASAQLSRARTALAKNRERRAAREKRQQMKEQLRADLRRDQLDEEMGKLAVRELEKKYHGLAGLPIAFVMALASLACLIGILVNPQLIILFLMMSFGFGMGAAGIAGESIKANRLLKQLQPIAAADGEAPGEVVERRHGARRADKAPAPSQVEADPLSLRLEEACDRLDQALKNAPEQVKTFLSGQTGKTIEQLRASGRELARREKRLRELSDPSTLKRIQEDQASLDARIAQVTDPSVRESFFRARAALKEKQDHFAQLAGAASRIEAERLRLSYTLESLHAQIMRLAASSSLGLSDPLSAPIRASLEQLQEELSALAEATDELRQQEQDRIPEALAEFESPNGQHGSERSRVRD